MLTGLWDAVFRHPAGRGVRLGLLCALAAWFVGHRDIFGGVEAWMLDSCFQLRGVRPTQTRVIIVGLDERSLEELGKPVALASPELAEAVTYLKDQGAAAIGLDLYVPEYFGQLPALQMPAHEARRLGEAAQSAGNVVLPKWRRDGRWKLPLNQWLPAAPGPTDIGYLNLIEDDDQFSRQVLPIHPDGPTLHFALAVYARSRGVGFAWDPAKRELRIGQEVVPLNPEGNLRINFVGPPGTMPTIPFHDVLSAARAGRELPALRGAIVLLGVTAWTEEDIYAVPFTNNNVHFLPGAADGPMGATEIHANIISTLHDRAFIRRLNWINSLPFLLLAGVVLGAAYARLSVGWGLLLLAASCVAWHGLGLLVFVQAGRRIEVVPMSLLTLSLFAATYGLRWRALRRTLGVVQSEPVAQVLEQDSRRLHLGGQETEVTVLFSDIRDFSSFSEKHSAGEVVALLNAYFTAIVPIIEAEDGTITTYLGDGIMVLFGAPTPHPDHALRAVRCAAAIVRRVRALADDWAALGNADFRIGIGIHTGRAVVGAIGSPQRLNFTAIGDTVNAAARIESENKVFGTEVLISATTFAALPEAERVRLGCGGQPLAAAVKGKQEELQLYPLVVPDNLMK